MDPSRHLDLGLTALAPAIWGSTYLVTTELLPQGYPLTAALLRALPAGIVLLALTRTLPSGIWIARSLILGALNFSLFWWLLFVAAYRLPGGVAATVGAIQPLLVLLLCRLLLDQTTTRLAVLAGCGGILGVALVVLTGELSLDAVGTLAALAGAVSMAFGTVLTRKWHPPVSALTFTSWQLLGGGLLLLPIALWLEPPLPSLSMAHMAGFAYLGLFGGAITYFLWFRGISRLNPSTVTPLGLLSPVSAVCLGWLLLEQNLHAVQIAGIVLVLISVWLGQRSQRKPA
ncbi:EamA family transporter [Granulosicoccus sp. 3-233]|uniref:EamA family transporter n=1 Tax=Granulosicoccus sp. 3-233 TaxID=3417969 RepID=UPI003D347C4C